MIHSQVKGGGWKHVRKELTAACALLVTLIVFLFHAPFSKSDYLLSDSADYVRAARSPFLKTYFNTDSASPLQLYEMRNQPGFRTHPWDGLYFHGDNAAIRHFHAPFSFYAMHAVAQLSSRDRHQRELSSIVTAVTCGVIVLGLSAFEVPVSIAGMLALVAGIQSRYIEVSVAPSPHGWYMLFAVLFLFAFAAYLRDRQFKTLAIAAVILGFAFATLEFSLELVSSVPLALALLWLVDRRILGEFKALAISLAKALPIFLLTTFLLWPGGWLRGGYLESYGITGATVLLKNKALFGDKLTVADLYGKFFAGHEALLLLSAFVLFASFFCIRRKSISIVATVFLSYTAIALALGIADHFRLATYISEALLFLMIAAALLFRDTLGELSARARQFATVGALVVLVIVGVQEWTNREPQRLYRPWLQPILTGVSARVPPGSAILVNDNWEAYEAYLSRYDFEPTVSTTDATPRIPSRTQGIRYFLMSDRAPDISGVTLIATFPTNIPGHNLGLYQKAK